MSYNGCKENKNLKNVLPHKLQSFCISVCGIKGYVRPMLCDAADEIIQTELH